MKSEHFLTLDDIPLVLEWTKRADVVVIGPGLGLERETIEAVREIVLKSDKPLVIDADALKALGGKLDEVSGKPAVLTPHSKEFEILTGITLPPPEDLRSRIELVRREAARYRMIFLVKGKEDIISDGKLVRVNMTGNALMTVGGTGDTLTGIVAALIALGNSPMKAACAGAFINGLAGDLASRKEPFLTTSKLLRYIVEAISHILKEPVVERSLPSLSLLEELPSA